MQKHVSQNSWAAKKGESYYFSRAREGPLPRDDILDEKLAKYLKRIKRKTLMNPGAKSSHGSLNPPELLQYFLKNKKLEFACNCFAIE